MATSSLSAVGDEELTVRLITQLDQNIPNPFNPLTEIRFSLGKAGPVVLRIFDLQGRLIRTLVEEDRPAGEHKVVWDGTDSEGRPVASGVFFYRLVNQDGTLSKSMLLVK
jgi:hypothetical protein